jgi:hypothetical protein
MIIFENEYFLKAIVESTISFPNINEKNYYKMQIQSAKKMKVMGKTLNLNNNNKTLKSKT